MNFRHLLCCDTIERTQNLIFDTQEQTLPHFNKLESTEWIKRKGLASNVDQFRQAFLYLALLSRQKIFLGSNITPEI